jgi:hypothetical protein
MPKKEEAMTAIWQSIAVYDNPKMGKIPKNIFVPGKEQWLNYDNYNGFWYLENADTIVFVDRGTDSTADWGKDFDFVKFEIPSGISGNPYEIHSGMLEVHLQRREKLFELIRRHEVKNARFYGHSLGGGTVQIAALDIKLLMPEISVSVYAFDAPNPLDKIATEKYNSIVEESHCYYLQGEPVHDMPPEIMGFGRTKNQREFKPVEWWAFITDNVIVQAISVFSNTKLNAHHPLRLANAMNKQLEVE